MKKIILAIICLAIIFLSHPAIGANYAEKTAGYIFLQVEARGEAWYVYPADNNRYFLGRPGDAFKIMKTLALGAKHDFIVGTDIFPEILSGLILLDTETNGEAYYIYPKDNKKYYLGRPADAFKIMRELSQGITDNDLANIPINLIKEPAKASPAGKKILIANVPFTTQAPFGDWADSRQQNGCEEASSLMAVRWARGENLTKAEALKEIIGLSDFLLKKYGEARDTSTRDIIDWIFKNYFKFDRVNLVKNITVDSIIEELNRGNLVITPMDGRLLYNPNFKQPGPSEHMIVIRGYDPATKKFTTNDPGTRKGELYRYDATVLYKAIRDYPTGYHEIINQIEKSMIVVSSSLR